MIDRSDAREQGRKLISLPVGVAGVVLLAGAVTGFAVVGAPLLAWSMVGIAAAAALLLAPPYLRITAAVLAATCTRLLVATGLVSNFANFFHFPLALGVGLLAMLEPSQRSPVRRALGLGMLALLGVALTSWLLNSGDVLRPFLDWLVFAEPLLILYAIIVMPPERARHRFLWGLVVVIPVAQVPLAVYQALTLGFNDPVQGFFIGMGAGAHVAGAVSLVGSLVCFVRGFSSTRMKGIAGWLFCGVVLVLVPVMSDAKQVIVAFVPALVLAVLLSLRRQIGWTLIAFPLVAVLVFAVFSFYGPLRRALDVSLISRGVMGKMDAVTFIVAKLSDGWTHWIVGLGPGNSVSRVSLMGLETMVKHDSPVYLLGLRPAATTVLLWNLTASSRLFASSSAWSFISSWLGLLGDLGLAGLGVFVWTMGTIWLNLRERSGWEQAAARGVFLMMILLAFFYSWLEEPGYTLMAALVMGLGLTADARARAPG